MKKRARGTAEKFSLQRRLKFSVPESWKTKAAKDRERAKHDPKFRWGYSR